MWGVPWEEPRICRGCEKEPCTGNPIDCDNDARDRAGDEEYERKRDERDERKTTGVGV